MKYIIQVILTSKENSANQLIKYVGRGIPVFDNWEIFNKQRMITNLISDWRQASDGSEIWADNKIEEIKSSYNDKNDTISKYLRKIYKIKIKKMRVE